MGIDQTDRDEMIATATKAIAQLTETLRDHTLDLGEGAATRLARRYSQRTRPGCGAAVGVSRRGREGGHHRGAVAPRLGRHDRAG